MEMSVRVVFCGQVIDSCFLFFFFFLLEKSQWDANLTITPLSFHQSMS